MLRALASESIPWNEAHLMQVDERVAPAGHPDRNLTHLRESLLTVHAEPRADPAQSSSALSTASEFPDQPQNY
jgi:6-phosphogluconolactonase